MYIDSRFWELLFNFSPTLTFNVSQCFRTIIFIFVGSDRSSRSDNVCLFVKTWLNFQAFKKWSSSCLQANFRLNSCCKQSSSCLQEVFKSWLKSVIWSHKYFVLFYSPDTGVLSWNMWDIGHTHSFYYWRKTCLWKQTHIQQSLISFKYKIKFTFINMKMLCFIKIHIIRLVTH